MTTLGFGGGGGGRKKTTDPHNLAEENIFAGKKETKIKNFYIRIDFT
jgi:hypothetical protein